MIQKLTRFRSSSGGLPKGRPGRYAKPTALIAMALIVGIAAVALPRQRTANAATLLPPGFDRHNGAGFCPVTTHLINTQDDPAPRDAGPFPAVEGKHSEVLKIMVIPQAQMEPVWSADMTVGKTKGVGLTYMGYIPRTSDRDDFEGRLDDITFFHDGVDFIILGIFQQELGDSFQQLVLNTNAALPNDLTFAAGDDRFALAKAVHFGTRHNIHIWSLNKRLDWAERQVVPVGLLEPSVPKLDPGLICH